MINLINNKMGVENVPFGFGLVDSPEASIILKSTNMKEIYKDIPCYEGYYQISNLGNVKSIPRKILNQGEFEFISKEKILKNGKCGKQGNDYFKVDLYKNGSSKRFKIHQLMAIVFLNHQPSGNKIVVDHINNDRFDNRIENLQLIPHRENLSKDMKKRSSKYVGVRWDKKINKWQARIYIKEKRINLGYFTDELEAHLAYQKALNEIL
jgi:hypothetical protein